MNMTVAYEEFRSQAVWYAREYLPVMLKQDYVAQLAAWKKVTELFDGSIPTLTDACARYDVLGRPGRGWCARRAAKALVQDLASRAHGASRACDAAMDGRARPVQLPDDVDLAGVGLSSVELDPYDAARVVIGVKTPSVRISASPQVDPDVGCGLGVYAVEASDDPLEEPRLGALVEHDQASASVHTLVWDEAGAMAETVNIAASPPSAEEGLGDEHVRQLPKAVADLLDSDDVLAVSEHDTPSGGLVVEVSLRGDPIPEELMFDFSERPRDYTSTDGWLRNAVEDAGTPCARRFLDDMARAVRTAATTHARGL